jgi:hypothetical protein
VWVFKLRIEKEEKKTGLIAMSNHRAATSEWHKHTQQVHT